MELRSSTEKSEKIDLKRYKNAEKVRKWREKVKNDTTKYEVMKQKDRERKKAARKLQRQAAEVNQQKMQKLRKQKREEMKKYRQKKKQRKRSANDTCSKKTLNREKKQLAILRTQKWRLRIKLQKNGASSMNSQQNSDVTSNVNENKGSPTSTSIASSFSSRFSKYRHVKKTKETLPSTPNRKAEVIAKLIESPETANVLSKKGVILSPECKKKLQIADSVLPMLKRNISEVKDPNSSKSEKKHAFNVLQSAVMKSIPQGKKKLVKNYFGLSTKSKSLRKDWWKRAARKRRCDSLKLATTKTIKEFFLSAEISREVPNKREVVKIKNKDGTKLTLPKHVMTMTLEEAYKTFKSAHPEIKIGQTAFSRLKPVNVKKITETNRRSCLCQVCCNFALKLDALKKHMTSIQTPEVKDTFSKITIGKDTFSEVTMCRHDVTPAAECIERRCERCGVNKISEILQPVSEASKEKNITWYHWEPMNITKDDKIKRCISCVPKESTFDEFLNEIKNDLKVYPEHIFRATWQQKQMKNCIENLKPGSIALVMDFSENYGCVFQSEVQSGFFDRNQVTIHPIMAYYQIKDTGPNDQNTINYKHAIIGISDDTKHDADSVLQFENRAIKIIAQNMGKEVTEVHEWTDGCASQYKGKKSFADISLRKKPKVFRNFFETSHGKNVCDGLGAIVKNSCYRAVVSNRKVIGTAEDVYKHCQDSLEMTSETMEDGTGVKNVSKREFIFSKDIQRNRHETNIETLKGTRKLHAVQSTKDNYVIRIRNLSCYCQSCNSDRPCENLQHSRPWETRTLKLIETQCSENIEVLLNVEEEVAPHPSLDKEQSTWETGTFVAVCLRQRKSGPAHVFMAEVLGEIDAGVQVRYMKRSGNKYIWPEEEEQEVSCEPKSHIIGTVSAPELMNERGHFVFSAEDMENIKKQQLKDTKQVYFK